MYRDTEGDAGRKARSPGEVYGSSKAQLQPRLGPDRHGVWQTISEKGMGGSLSPELLKMECVPWGHEEG